MNVAAGGGGGGEEEEDSEKKKKLLERDQQHKEAIDRYTEYLVDALESVKEIDRAYEESGKAKEFRKIEYVDREEDPQLKAMFDE